MGPREDLGEGPQSASQSYPIRRLVGTSVQDTVDTVAEEVPVALEFNGVSYAVMLASPTDLEDFALGFALTEGIIQDASELFSTELDLGPTGITVRVGIASERFVAMKERRRALAGRTGCGLCGVESLDQVVRPVGKVVRAMNTTADALSQGFETLQRQQRLMSATGAVHAAGILSSDGVLVLAREDVGRHNALDKALGAAAKSRVDLSSHAAIVTSRASFEMVQKAAVMGVPILAAISAPTGLAIRLARDCGMALVGFVRDDSLVCYTSSERIL
jgi:FdhD protein